MADYDSYALPEPTTDAEYARQYEQALLADRKRKQIAMNADRQRQASTAVQDDRKITGTDAASTAARRAYARTWQLAEEGVQDFALSFLDLMLISGPAAIAIFVTRLIGGNVLGGAGTITFREVTVPRIPGYSAPEGVYKFGKIVLIGLLSALIYSIIIILLVLVTNPGLIAELAWCAFFDGLLSFIGINACSGA